MKKTYKTPILAVIDQNTEVVLYETSLEKGTGRPDAGAKESFTDWDDEDEDFRDSEE